MKIPWPSQKIGIKTLLADRSISAILGDVNQLFSNQLTVYLTLECNGESNFSPLLHTDVKSPFHLAETPLNSRQVINMLFLVHSEQCGISWTNVHAKWNRLVILISLRCHIPPAISVHGLPKRFWGLFWCHHVFWTTAAFDIIDVCICLDGGKSG